MIEIENNIRSLMIENEALRQRVFELEKNLVAQQYKETSLHKEYGFFQRFIDEAPGLLWQSNTSGEAVYCNKSWLNFVGLELTEVLSGGWRKAIHNDDWTEYSRVYQNAVRHHSPFTREYRLKKRCGQYSWMIDTGRPIFDKEGKFQGYVGASFDITEHKRRDQELEMSEKKYRELFNHSNSGIILDKITDNHAFGFIEANDQVCRMLEYTREELMEKDFSLICYERNRIKEIVSDLWTGDHTIGEVLLETYLCTKSGRYLPVEVSFKYFELYDQQYILWAIRDISQRKKIEERFRQSELRYRKLFKFCPEALFVVDEEKILLANKAAAELLRVEKVDELIGRASLAFVHTDYHEACIQNINMMKNERKNASPLEGQFVRSDGSLVDVEVAGTYIYYEDKMSYLLIARDISDRKKFDKLKNEVDESNRRLIEAVEYDKLKSEFFANISHELKTPLNVILGAVQLQELYLNSSVGASLETTQKNIRMIKQNSYRLIRLVNNLIDITKIDCGYMQLRLKNEDIVKMVRDITSSVQDYAQLKGISIECHMAIPQKLMACDPDHIERVLLNLISNAIKFTDKGGRIDVFLSEDDREGCIILSVMDTGIGIPKEEEEIIFERFRQVDKSLCRNHEGSGIGLSIAKALIEMHGGSITVESEYGKGSVFTVKLPVTYMDGIRNEVVGENVWSHQIERINIEFSDIYF